MCDNRAATIPSPLTNIWNVDPKIIRELCNILDTADEASNWKTLVAQIPGTPFKDYDIKNFEKAIIANDSPTRLVLHALGNRLSKTVRDLIMYLDAMKSERALKLLKHYEPLEVTEEQSTSGLDLRQGDSLRLSCSATGFPYPRYQWFRGKEKLIGREGNELLITNISPDQEGRYCCRLHNCTKESVKFTRCVSVTVTPISDTAYRQPDNKIRVCGVSAPRTPPAFIPTAAPVICEQPASCQLWEFKPLVLRCVARGQPPLTYTWYKNERRLVQFTEPELVIERCKVTDHGQYQCTVTNSIGSTTSQVAHVEIHPRQLQGSLGAPEVIGDPMDQSSEKGACITLSCQARGEAPLFYQWYKDGINIPGANESSYLFTLQSSYSQGKYSCHVSNAIGSAFSKQAAISIIIPLEKRFAAKDKVALLIANSDYRAYEPLYATKNDIEELKVILQELNFKVVPLLNLNLVEMQNAVRIYCDLLDEGVYGIFYFAGHGFEKDGQCYMVPVDCPIRHRTQECLCDAEVLAMTQRKSPQLNTMMLDICRTENLDAAHDIQTTYRPAVSGNTCILYATSFTMQSYEEPVDNPEAPDPNQTNLVSGIFMIYLKRHLMEKISVEEVFANVRQDIGNDAKASNIQFPEVRANLRDIKRSFTDPINYTGETQAFSQRSLLWENAHQVTDVMVMTIPDLGIQVELSFKAVLSNVLTIYAKVVNPGLSQLCEASIIEIPAALDATVEVVSGPPQGPFISQTTLTNIQRLRENFQACLQVNWMQNSTWQPPVTLRVDLGKPLVAVLDLWYDPRGPPSQENAQVQRKMPVESEC